MRAKFLCLPLALLLLLPCALYAQTVIRTPDTTQPLATRWQWALQKADSTECGHGCWIGYSIERRMNRDSYIGSWNDFDTSQPSLGEIIYGKRVVPGTSTADGKVSKQVALLFRVDPKTHAIAATEFSNLSHSVTLHAPLIWIGRSADAPSLDLVEGFYARTHATDVKKHLLTAIGLHDSRKLVVPFLGKVLNGQAADEVRGAAAFWLGQGGPDALELLTHAARNDRSERVREKAVFAISLIKSPAATDTLIDLAEHANDRGVREKALFWLAQVASKKAVAALAGVAQDDPDVDIRKKAVFALSRLPADQGVPRLIKIAKTSRSVEVRKQAIFWLGQSGDPRAVQVLAKIARGDSKR
ncbi:MAG TPA: HEAT repeat domain-containing protein [Gammaproteobacteria bacterium]|nr:HEAT repeat domain-containing protein [Gammaproteobacteria bacterium]